MKIKRAKITLFDSKGASCKLPSYLNKFLSKSSKTSAVNSAFEEILNIGVNDEVARKRSKKTIPNDR